MISFAGSNFIYGHLSDMESLRNLQFDRVYKEGRSRADQYIVMYALKNDIDGNRFGIVCSKKVGNSIVRHRVRRIIREAIRLHETEFMPGWDIVIIARKPIITKKSTDMENSIGRLGKKFGIIQS